MSSLPPLDPPSSSKDSLIRALESSHDSLRDVLLSLPAGSLAERPSPERWSAEEHVRHLVTSVNAVAAGLGYPKLLIRLRFGKAKASRSYEEVVADYRSHLADGGRASGKFVPKTGDRPMDTDEARDALLGRWRRACDRLTQGLDSWSESQLDSLRFPHPLLGKLTVREMLYFTHYHNGHHAFRIQEDVSSE